MKWDHPWNWGGRIGEPKNIRTEIKVKPMDAETLFRLNKHATCEHRQDFLCAANGNPWLVCAALEQIHGACPKKTSEEG